MWRSLFYEIKNALTTYRQSIFHYRLRTITRLLPSQLHTARITVFVHNTFIVFSCVFYHVLSCQFYLLFKYIGKNMSPNISSCTIEWHLHPSFVHIIKYGFLSSQQKGNEWSFLGINGHFQTFQSTISAINFWSSQSKDTSPWYFSTAFFKL